jgi:hypothetical protein
VTVAKDILVGKRKLVGDTRDGSYGLVDDDTDIIGKYPDYFKNRPVEKYVVREKSDEDYYFDHIRQDLKAYKVCLKNSAIKSRLITEDHGWLRPDGKFFEIKWGAHESWAITYVEKYYPGRNICYAGDFLKEHGWLLLHSPGGGSYVNIPVDDIQSATKRQKEFLYDYFLERGRTDDANLIWGQDEGRQGSEN